MVYCPSCSEQQDDNTKFCRFCGGNLPGENMMMKLRQEAMALASIRSGRNLSDSQSQTEKTMQAIEHNSNYNNNSIGKVNNGEHKQSTMVATNNLKNLIPMDSNPDN